MLNLRSAFATVADLVAAPLDDVAAHALRILDARLPTQKDVECSRNFSFRIAEEYRDPREGFSYDVLQVCGEALDWLRLQGLIYQHPDHDIDWFAVTRRGRDLAKETNLRQWLADRELPAFMLHPALAHGPLALYRQGRFDTAVFEAFKALEVAIRSAAGFGPDKIGVALASGAFHPETGPLTDQSAEKGERQALMSLMTGAIGSYKNPQSHRHVGLSPAEAREMLLLASHLYKIVDSRSPAPSAASDAS